MLVVLPMTVLLPASDLDCVSCFLLVNEAADAFTSVSGVCTCAAVDALCNWCQRSSTLKGMLMLAVLATTATPGLGIRCFHPS